MEPSTVIKYLTKAINIYPLSGQRGKCKNVSLFYTANIRNRNLTPKHTHTHTHTPSHPIFVAPLCLPSWVSLREKEKTKSSNNQS